MDILSDSRYIDCLFALKACDPNHAAPCRPLQRLVCHAPDPVVTHLKKLKRGIGAFAGRC